MYFVSDFNIITNQSQFSLRTDPFSKEEWVCTQANHSYDGVHLTIEFA